MAYAFLSVSPIQNTCAFSETADPATYVFSTIRIEDHVYLVSVETYRERLTRVKNSVESRTLEPKFERVILSGEIEMKQRKPRKEKRGNK